LSRWRAAPMKCRNTVYTPPQSPLHTKTQIHDAGLSALRTVATLSSEKPGVPVHATRFSHRGIRTQP
jgi:hypothetical protein